MSIEKIYSIFKQNPIISIDSRNVAPNSIFFALKGDNFDANVFAEDALSKGAILSIIDKKEYFKNDKEYFLVNDALKTLQDLANFHRKSFQFPIIGLTGSNGKTTTKELINAVLSKKYKTVATQGNLNNHIGVPLTLFSMNDQTEIGIVEMGANHPNEIAMLCNICEPNIGYITNFGKAHLEGFGSLEGVVKAKTELYSFLKRHDGLAFVNDNDERQVEETLSQRHFFLEKVELIDSDSVFISVRYENRTINTHLVGNYNLPNIAAAISLGKYFNVDTNDIVTAIESYQPDNKRSQLIDKDYCKIILDAYNANPSSMQAAIENFTKNETENKVVILGDMLELGEYSQIEHQNIVDQLKNKNAIEVYLIGERFLNTNTTGFLKYKTFEDFKNSFEKSNFKDKMILIKGSRGMALERVSSLF